MRLRWKIAIGVAALIVLVPAGAFTWMVFFKPNGPATIAAPGPTGRRIAQDDIYANYYPSPRSGRQPAIVVVGGSEGGLSHDVNRQALLLQKAGYNVMQLAYFNVPGKPSKLEHVPLEQFFHAFDWLKAQPEVDPAALGMSGYSKGAEAAMMTASRYPGLGAIVAGMPSSVAWGGMSARNYIFGGTSSWSLSGKDMPSLAYAPGDGTPAMLPRFVGALKTLPAHPDAAIPVERYTGKLLLICGGSDTLWPSCMMSSQIAARARKAGHGEPGLLTYPLAGHGVMGAPLLANDPIIKGFSQLGGTPRDNAAARADSWPRIVAFFDAALREQTANPG